ncbi:hypothetical protein A11A3_12460 [Alcanivorax hongdengensis A-11-3]|uniref:DUF445 domain-containing protein n=1 Tax=Alcanivorax hongdengensis A-11-3 TaxID=1177179 RepID=L0WA58_9GAMM|nr:DUF445 family protein [Alcanivorax hongdengensis]EKF73653.1 hypothetical protein A11A3_12460 [Alcanivorax hongdengensis A-11-3]
MNVDIHEILADVQANWILYLSMPFVAATIGYFTKIVAIRMMFKPLEFVGKPPLFGWQGIVPRRAATMASIACDLMMERLLKPEDVFNKLDPHRVAEEIRDPLIRSVEDITREVAAEYQPGLWESSPESVKRLVIQRIQKEAPHMVELIMEDIKNNIDRVFDLKDMVVNALVRDKELLNRVFLEAGHVEFKFIARSGIYFGFIIGCLQAVAWALTHNIWVMPLFGLFTGWFTDWLALKMIFNPKQPVRYLGLFEWQGLFLRRRKQVSARYGELVASEIVTPAAVIEAILKGPLSDRLFGLVQKQVQRTMDEQAGLAKPLVVFAVGSTKYQEMKRSVSEKVMQYLPETLSHMEAYAEEAMDLKTLLVGKMQELSEEEFEGLLRPAFQQDEWILITVGALLGFLVGELQVHVMLHFAVHV